MHHKCCNRDVVGGLEISEYLDVVVTLDFDSIFGVAVAKPAVQMMYNRSNTHI